MRSESMPKAYDFREVEERWYSYWEQNDFFHADVTGNRPSFSIVIPPPNVTGQLHMGHALNNTLQDILARYKRLKGFEVLWVPGTDHAGIATQNVVERQLNEQGLSRYDLGREAFLKKVWEWKEKSGGIIIRQLKRLGCSCDWKRQRFTMDEGLSRAVREVFVQLYKEGLVYRGHRMINWCPRCRTALANIEVEIEERQSKLYYVRYPLADGSGSLVVATTRPETMLGDTAVAVHPEDSRYKALIGKKVVLPLVDRLIPVIEDTYVDMEFGTGVLKVTPAHDFNDFEISRRHGLQSVQVIGIDGKMTEEAGPYKGLGRYECRDRVLDDLARKGYLVKVEDYVNRVGHCYRCKDVVEPMLSTQWFVSTKPLAERAIEAVRTGKTRIIPPKWRNDYFAWMTNIEDWCISRQIWWGHRIPAWYCEDCGAITVSVADPTCCSDCKGTRLTQDEDVLDTWFSSALWPFTTMGWPEETPELKRFYPTSVLVTGFDILFFWVARMMMMGLHFMGDVPFYDVYVHALVRDAEGQKMSKSRGNVIDPIVMMDRYGTDALRFTLTAFAVQGRDIKLSEERIEGYRHFVNKLWNASRLLLMNIGPKDSIGPVPPRIDNLVHRWILSRLQSIVQQVDSALEHYHFNQYAQTLYHFIWHEYCDWYLEMIKSALYGEDAGERSLAQSVATLVLKDILIMLHPVMPFVTEEIWQKLPDTEGSIMVADFPRVDHDRLDPEAEQAMELIREVTSAIRNIRGEMNIPPSARLNVVCLSKDGVEMDVLKSHRYIIEELARLSEIKLGLQDQDPKPQIAAKALAGDVEVYVLLEDVIDFEAESKRLQKEIAKVEKELAVSKKKLGNVNFLEKAPSSVVTKEKEKAARFEEKLAKLRMHLERVENIKEGIRSGS